MDKIVPQTNEIFNDFKIVDEPYDGTHYSETLDADQSTGLLHETITQFWRTYCFQKMLLRSLVQ